MQTRLIVLGLLSVLGLSAPALGFAEDLTVTDAGISNCLTSDGTTPTICVSGQGAGRSMIHVDSTFFIAQALGFKDDIAYWLAAYDDATDLGTYQPFDNCGKALGDVRKQTEAIPSVVRTSLTTGGLAIHFPTAFSVDGTGADLVTNGVTGLYPFYQSNSKYPAIDTVYEGSLSHLRRWAMTFDAGSTPPVLCNSGFTQSVGDSYFAGSACYTKNDAGVPINGLTPLSSADGGSQAFQTVSGRQYLFAVNDPKSSQPLQTALDAGNGRRWNGSTAAVPAELVRMAVYLHSVQDRVSHQYCGDASLARTADAGSGFIYSYSMLMCSSINHAQGHFDEIGRPTLPLRVFTALNITYDELQKFAEAMRLTHSDWFSAPAPLFLKEDLVGRISTDSPDGGYSGIEIYVPARLTTPLTVSGASSRMNAMNAAILDAGLLLMPGMTGCN